MKQRATVPTDVLVLIFIIAICLKFFPLILLAVVLFLLTSGKR